MSNASDFVIEEGVLKAYTGTDSCMVIPEGVTTIGESLLANVSHVDTVVIPASVTRIEHSAFCGKWGWNEHPEYFTLHLTDLDAFCKMGLDWRYPFFDFSCKRRFYINGQLLEELTIPAGITEVSSLFNRCEDLKKLVIPEGVTELLPDAFSHCKNLTHVSLPRSLTKIPADVFAHCPLTRLDIAEGSTLKIGRIFSYTFPGGLMDQLEELACRMNAEGIKNYIFPNNWKLLSEDAKAQIYLTYQDATMKKYYKKNLKPADFDPLSEAILRRMGQKMTKKECGILADFMITNVAYLSGGALKTMYDTIKGQKSGADAVITLDGNAAVKKKLSSAPAKAAPKADRGPRSKNDVAFDNMGFDDNGVKVYELGGGKEVHAVIQPDFTVLLLDPKTGKTSKSVPKKGADPELYAAATGDFKALFKGIKTLYNICKDALYTLYLDAAQLSPENWKLEWTGNHITATLASMVVWQQGETCFILENRQPVTVTGEAYALTVQPIRVAHTADLTGETVTAWQRYFNEKGRKQPFLQIWEPVRKAEDIRSDRYKGVSIRNGYLYNQKLLGVDVYIMPNGWDDSIPGVLLTLTGFDVSLAEGSADGEFEITSITPKIWNRRSNAIISFLDRISLYGRLHKDDETIAEILDQFTFEQIVDFLAMATKHSLPKVTALLLDYKQTHFGDYDPMDDFILEL